MPAYTTADIRNVLLAGHGQAGKTTLIDAMLFAAGMTGRKGSTLDGSSFSDFEKDEKERKHSIYSSLLYLDHQGKRINLIDSPGSSDLIGGAMSCLPAVETMMCVINAQAGIEVVARRMMEAAIENNLPRVIVINKLDLPELDLPALVSRVQEIFGPECLPVNLPASGGKAVVNCLENRSGDSDILSVQQCHTAIVEQIVELEEQLMENYLAGEEPDIASLHGVFERAVDQGHLVPMLFTDARSGVGVAELIDFIAKWLPSPLEGNLRPFVTISSAGKSAQPATPVPFKYWNDPAKPLLAHVFKVTTDPFVGKLALFRVHQGKCSGQTQVFVGSAKKAIKLGHLLQIQGKEHKEVPEVIAGDIAAVAKIEDIHVNDVLHDDQALGEVRLAPIMYPTPMFGLAITPKTRGDEGKMSAQLARIAEEDPCFKWTTDRQTHEVVIYGIGEMHLRLILERMAVRGLHVDTKPPKIAYRETIQQKAEGHHRHKKQSGGAGQFGEVFLRVEPLPSDSPLRKDKGGVGLEIVNEVFGGAIPGQFIPAVEKGIHDVMEQGAIAGYPIQDLRVAITDGKHHPVDSKEVAFRTAGKYALRDAILKAKPVLLEPIVYMEVSVPEDKVGTITGDLSGKRGRIQGQDFVNGGMAVVKAEAPLAEVMSYQNQLKSVTGGQGSFSMEFDRYEAVPPQVQQQIAAQYHPRTEEE